MTSLRSISIPSSQMHPVRSAGSPSDAERDDSDIGLILGTLWRKKFTILLVTLVALGIGAAYAFELAVPRYTTHAVLTLEPTANPVAEMPDVMSAFSGEDTVVNTELEILRSRGLMRELVRQLGLTDDPEFNPALWPPSLISIAAASLGIQIDPSTGDDPEHVVVDATVSELVEAISVSNIRETYVFHIGVTTTSPEKSARIADALMNLYIERRMHDKFAATEQSTRWLTDRVGQLKTELQQAESALKNFRTTTDLVAPESLELLNRQLKDLRDRYTGVRASADSIAARLAAYEALGENADPQLIADALDDRTLQESAGRVAEGITRPDVFDAQVQRAIQQLQTQLLRDRGQVQTLQSAIATLEEKVEHQSSELLVLEQLEREVAATALIYETLLARLKEVSIRQGTQQADARIVTTAPLPTEPSAPNVPLVLAFSGMLGLFIGSGLVLGRERMQNTFRTAAELERLTGETVLGEIPSAPTKKRRKLLEHLVSGSASPFAEAIRDLRTSILMADLEHPTKVIMITSSIPGEGKTTQALSLTYNFAALGKRVLLIEADIRRRPLAEYLDPDEAVGNLGKAVQRPEDLAEFVVYSEAMKADLMIAGNMPINAADFFSSQPFAELLKVARQQYDLIIIDTPPVLSVPDARVIGRLADAIVYVVRWDHTSKVQVMRGLRSLAKVNLKVTGLALSQINPKGMKRYGYHDHAGSYGHGYHTS